MGFSNVCIEGRLTAAPELQQTPGGMSVCHFSVAINRDKNSTDFIRAVAFGKTAEFLCQYFKKGKPLAASGSLRVDKWTDKNGASRETTEVLCDRIFFTESDKGAGGGQEHQPEQKSATRGASTRETTQSANPFGPLDVDADDLPF